MRLTESWTWLGSMNDDAVGRLANPAARRASAATPAQLRLVLIRRYQFPGAWAKTCHHWKILTTSSPILTFGSPRAGIVILTGSWTHTRSWNPPNALASATVWTVMP